MKTKNYFILTIILLSFSLHCTENVDIFYSTTFLKNYVAIRACLKARNFKEVTFKTDDNLTLHGLFLERPAAKCNVIVCAGWLPGKQEDMATFYALLPQYCNILFFDARGHGNSDGSLLWKLWQYGIHEYKDILGAISYINDVNNLPIIIVGICSGAFNAAHALISLEKNNQHITSRVRGLVFDSGWASVTEISRTAPPAGLAKRFSYPLTFIYKTKKDAKQSYLYQLSTFLTRINYKIMYQLCIKPLVGLYEQTTTLFDKMHHITSPILFIHSHDDTYAIKHDAWKLANLTTHKVCWWIKQSFHAKHHLIHKKLYKEKVTAFIENIIE